MDVNSRRNKPCKPQLRWDFLGRMLRLWRSYGVTDAHCVKMLRLWLGYEFLDLMDDQGRYPLTCYNEIRQRLHYPTWEKLVGDIRRCRTFSMVGSNPTRPTVFFSPVWHDACPGDGPLMNEREQQLVSQEMSHEMSHTCDGNKIYSNTTVGNGEAVDPCPDYRRNEVLGYWQWVETRTDQDHVSLVAELKDRLRYTRDRTGHVVANETLTDEQVEQAWQVLVRSVLVPYFITREQFFEEKYRSNPEKRIYWMRNLMKKQGKAFTTEARKRWRKRRLAIEAEALDHAQREQRNHHPVSPYEWMDEAGVRWYTVGGEDTMIPADAAARPSATSMFNFFHRCWG